MDRNKEISGHFYEVELAATTIKRVKVEVFIPDSVKTAEGQRVLAEAQADAEQRWVTDTVKVTVTSLEQKNRATIVDAGKYSDTVDKAYWPEDQPGYRR